MIAAGATLFAVGALFHVAVPLAVPTIPPQFDNGALFRDWEGWTSRYMVLHPLGFGVVFAAVYLLLRSRDGVASGWQGGLLYGAGLFVVGGLPVYLLAFASFQVSPEVITSWIVQCGCQYLAAGAAVGWTASHGEPDAPAGSSDR